MWAPVAGGTVLDAWSPVPWLRGTALEAQVLVAGIVPWNRNLIADYGGARGIAAEASVSVSLRWPDIRDDTLRGRPASETAVKAGRC